MKKIFGVLGVTMMSLAYSQSFGVKGGANISTISKENTWGDTNSKIGFYVGAYMNAPVNALLSIQPELIYNNLGVKYENNNKISIIHSQIIEIKRYLCKIFY